MIMSATRCRSRRNLADRSRSVITDRNRSRRAEPWALRNGRWIVLIGGSLTIVVGLFAVLILPGVDRVVGEFTGGDLQRARADARSSGLALATGIGVATAGLLTWGRSELSRRQHQLDRRRDQTAERNASLQHRLAEQSQRNDRFARAIELLGHSDHAVRLGALYALEGLAKDGHEQQAVYDVICAFARLHVPQVLSADVETLGVSQVTCCRDGTRIGGSRALMLASTSAAWPALPRRAVATQIGRRRATL